MKDYRIGKTFSSEASTKEVWGLRSLRRWHWGKLFPWKTCAMFSIVPLPDHYHHRRHHRRHHHHRHGMSRNSQSIYSQRRVSSRKPNYHLPGCEHPWARKYFNNKLEKLLAEVQKQRRLIHYGSTSRQWNHHLLISQNIFQSRLQEFQKWEARTR